MVPALTLALGVMASGAALAWGAPPPPTHFHPPIPGGTTLTGSWTYLHGTQQGNLPDVALSASGDGALQIKYNWVGEISISNSTCSFVQNEIVGQNIPGQTTVNLAYLVDPTVRECTFVVGTVPVGVATQSASVLKVPLVVHYENRTPSRHR